MADAREKNRGGGGGFQGHNPPRPPRVDWEGEGGPLPTCGLNFRGHVACWLLRVCIQLSPWQLGASYHLLKGHGPTSLNTQTLEEINGRTCMSGAQPKPVVLSSRGRICHYLRSCGRVRLGRPCTEPN